MGEQGAVARHLQPRAVAGNPGRVWDTAEPLDVLVRRGREHHPDPTAKPADQTLRSVHRRHPALMDHGDAVAELLRLLHEMGDQDDGGTTIPYRPHQLP